MQTQTNNDRADLRLLIVFENGARFLAIYKEKQCNTAGTKSISPWLSLAKQSLVSSKMNADTRTSTKKEKY